MIGYKTHGWDDVIDEVDVSRWSDDGVWILGTIIGGTTRRSIRSCLTQYHRTRDEAVAFLLARRKTKVSELQDRLAVAERKLAEFVERETIRSEEESHA